MDKERGIKILTSISPCGLCLDEIRIVSMSIIIDEKGLTKEELRQIAIKQAREDRIEHLEERHRN